MTINRMTRFAALLCSGGFLAAWMALINDGSPSSPAESLTRSVNEIIESESSVMPAVDKRFSAHTDEVPDFQRHVGPLLGRLGCNGRACHGSFQGQGGFQLTLFGYDFDADHQSMIEDGTLRVDLEDPEDSLILAKPTDADDHGGGVRFEEGDWQYQLIHNWVAGGAKNYDDTQKLESLTVTPSEIETRSGQIDQIRVIANWSDGVSEDVTPLTRFQSNDPQVATVDQNGKVVGTNPGDTHLIVLYDNEVVSVPVLSPVASISNSMPFDNPTRIDELVMGKLNKLGIQPSPISDDAAFLRRVSLDMTGTLPTPDEIREFVANDNPEKRSDKIEQYIESNAFNAWWTTFLCDLTGNSGRQLRNAAAGNMAIKGWYDWIYKRVEENTPYDEIVEGIVLSATRLEGETLTDFYARMSKDYQGNTTERFVDSPTMPYYWMRQDFRTDDTLAISFAHSFLGVRIQCAQCHKHPFDQWTKTDFQHFARFFSGVKFSPYQRVAREEKPEYDAVMAKLEYDAKLRGGQLQRQLYRMAREPGVTVPFPQLVVGPPQKSREDLQAEMKAEKEKRAEMMDSEMMNSDMDSEMMNSDMMQEEPEQKKPLTKKQRRELRKQQQLARREAQRLRNRNRFFTDAILLGSDSVELKDFDDAREPAMKWLKSENNPYFAKAIVNRIWAKYFGVGIVEPADDLNLANPPSNGPLLEYLADGFVENGYDLRWVHRQIANSNVYQLSWETNETNRDDRRNFSRALPRRLPAEVLYDALSQATTSTEELDAFRNSTGSRAIAMPDVGYGRGGRRNNSVQFAMRIFGKSLRMNSCDCDRSDETSLVQTVFMQNDRHIHEQLSRESGWLGQMRKAQQGPDLEKAKRQMKKLDDSLRRAKKRKNKNQIRKAQQQIARMQERLDELESSQQELVSDVDVLIESAYLRTLGRFPTADEVQNCRSYIEQDKSVVDGLTGVMWALMNTKEFIVNH